MSVIDNYPTFLGVGAARSGTTSLYHWLDQHPAIFMSPVKEPNYFSGLHPNFRGPGDEQIINCPLQKNSDGRFIHRHAAIVTSREQYCELFLGAENYSIRGEISPSYLYYPTAVIRIRNQLPESKIVIILRDPVERAFSQYKLFVMNARETKEFVDAIYLEDARIKGGWEYAWAYRGLGLYSKAVERFLDLFSLEQVGIWLYEDLRQLPAMVYAQICNFLGADHTFKPDFSPHNPSQSKVTQLQWHYNRYGHIIGKFSTRLPESIRSGLGHWVERAMGDKVLILEDNTRRELLEYYRKDIWKLNQLLPKLGVLSWIEYQERILTHAG